MPHAYDDRFFAWVNRTATRSARVVLPVVQSCAAVRSVVDVGCGQGAWLGVWSDLGVTDVAGLDGAYVDRSRLLVRPDRFTATDLATPFSVPRRFDLAQSLEVAEHLPPAAGPGFVASLCALSDVVLFSAAQPGQGGEAHVNERPTSYWARQFEANGFSAFDAIRPRLSGDRAVAPWYRANTMLYANAAGAARLSGAAQAARCNDLGGLDGAGGFGWQLRCMLLRPLPEPVVTALSRLRYRVACAADRAIWQVRQAGRDGRGESRA